MVTPNIIIRSNRRTLSLSINKDAELVVRAPKKLSLEKIFQYINEKEKWILTKQKEISSRKTYNSNILDYSEYLFLGKRYKLMQTRGIKKIEMTSEYICAPDSIDKDAIMLSIRKWYVKTAKNILYERIEYYSKLMNLSYNSLKIENCKSRWGSCDTKRNIRLNFRLIMLPHSLLDYVVVHELSHLVEFNHSKNFYKIMQVVIPNYKSLAKEIKEYDYLLKIYR